MCYLTVRTKTDCFFDKQKALKRIEELEGEQIKTARREMVLAVVGTMKAGKSTTINAIVGQEILPNRNRPHDLCTDAHPPRSRKKLSRFSIWNIFSLSAIY